MNHPASAANRLPGNQRGATLLVGLIILVLLTLHALSSFHTSTTQLRIVDNTQDRQSALAASQQAIGQVLSTTEFATNPAAVAARAIDVDIDGDNIPDFTITMAPACTATLPILNKDLDPDAPDDFDCIAGTSFGSASLCTSMQWDLKAVAVIAGGAAATGTTVEVHQGVAVRSETGTAVAQC